METMQRQSRPARIRRTLGTVVCIGVGLLFVYSATQHMRTPYRFLVSVNKYSIVSGKVSYLVAAGVPAVQFTLGIILVSTRFQKWPLFWAFMLVFGFTVAQVGVLFSGRQVSCACFGASNEQVSILSVARNVMLLIVLGFSLFQRWKANHDEVAGSLFISNNG